MASFATRWNLPISLQDALAAAATSHNTSRSKLVSAAIKAVPSTIQAAVAYRITQEPMELGYKPSSYIMDSEVYAQAQNLAERLGIARDALLRIALDYYLYKLESDKPNEDQVQA